ncbi:MAG: hypothetical protein ACPL1A_10230 [Candidatus Kapaibacteriota bacterium]
MKKIFILFVLSIFLNTVFLYPQQFGNCDYLSTFPPDDNCPAPWFRLNIEVPYNCDGQIYFARVNVCYYCYISANEVCYFIKRIDVPNGNPACHQEMLEAIEQWLMHYTYKYCGMEPCGYIDPQIIRVAFPMCAKMIYNRYFQGGYTLKYEDNCTKFCVKEFRWCYCLCDAACNKPPCPYPHVHIETLSETPTPPFASCDIIPIYWEADSEDPKNPIYYYNLHANYNWEVCLLISTPCLSEGFNGPLIP